MEQGHPISPLLKNVKKKKGIVIKDEFDLVKFFDIQVARLYNHLARVEFSDARLFDFCSLNKGGLEIEEYFSRFQIQKFCVVGDDFYPEMVKEFYANARLW